MKRAGIEKISPTVIIGLGGTGAKVVHQLKRRLVDVPVVRFLVVDSDPKTQTGEGEELQQNVEFVNIGVPVKIQEFIDGTWPYVGDDVTRKSLNSWFPYPAGHNTRSKAYETLEEGASQIRCLGRVALFYRVAAVRSAIADHLVYVGGDGVKEAEKKGINVDTKNRRVFIVSSLGGGQGTGIFLDVAYLVQTIRANPFEVNGFLVMPTAFKFAVAGSPRVWANSYAAMLELEHYQKYPDELRQHYAKDVVVRSNAAPPFKYIYVASGNPYQGPSLDIDQVCQITSEALYSHLVIDTTTSGGVDIGKFKAAGGIDASLRTEIEDELCCYSSFGYREIKLPGDQIAVYCRNRLGEKIAEELVKPDTAVLVDDRHVQSFVQNSKLELPALESESALRVSPPKTRSVTIRQTTTADELDSLFGQVRQDAESWLNTAKADMQAAIQEIADGITSDIAAESRKIANDPAKGGLHGAVWFIDKLQRHIPHSREVVTRLLDFEAERGRPGLRTQRGNRLTHENRFMTDLKNDVQRRGFRWHGNARKKAGEVETQIRLQADLDLKVYRLEIIDELIYRGVDASLSDLKNQWEGMIRCVESVRDDFYRNKRSAMDELMRDPPFYRTQIQYDEEQLKGFAREVDAVKKAKQLVLEAKGILYPEGKTQQQAKQRLIKRIGDFCRTEYTNWEDTASVVTELEDREMLTSWLKDLCEEGQYALWKLAIPVQDRAFIVKVLTVDHDQKDQVASIVGPYGVDTVVGVLDKQTIRVSHFEYAARRSLMEENSGCKDDYDGEVAAGNDVHAHLPFTKKTTGTATPP